MTAETTTPPVDPLAGQPVGTESSLSNWAGDYVTNMLGQGQALANQDYEAYTGPLVAGTNSLQNDALGGIAGLAMPDQDIMQQYATGSYTDPGVADQYMNPYIEGVVDPQVRELTRNAELMRLNDAAALTKAGAYGGSRQAIMDSETNRNLLQGISDAYGTGYSSAYDRGASQYNTEQDRLAGAGTEARRYGLEALGTQFEAGDRLRDIQQQGYTANRAQFEEERDFPYKQVQYLQSLLQGLPLAAQTTTYQEPSTLSNILGGAGGISGLYDSIFGTPPTTTDATTPTT